MYLKEHKNGKFSVEIIGYLEMLQIPELENQSRPCFISGDADCLTIGEIINTAGYDSKTILGRRLLITIEDEN